MRRNKVGIAGLATKQNLQERYKKQADQITDIQLQKVEEQIALFKQNLEKFAQKYKKHINKDPAFRKQFNDMCKTIGVDPLISSKGFWAQLLGVGDFYYELGIQIIEICMNTREINGGLIDMQILLQILQNKRGPAATDLSINDIERAVAKLEVFDNYRILAFGEKKLLKSIPLELSSDDTSVLLLSQDKGYVTPSMLKKHFSWDSKRIEIVCEFVLKEGIAWIDYGGTQEEGFIPGEPIYWIVGSFNTITDTPVSTPTLQ
uniref:Vacuolar-sorting protein SNF8 n=1 Tax=Arcella intermedia TaxID=1963864 RepID=A0A6B2LF47_9EUKA|eukprot:TRINITY_DN16337_c0_g1_i1.p1 TRINITY_DN16337_c0_g1~~TRINITY_DN16337_c0_g1_i1.p1  ORF type:complete len:261 (-),score=82.04 TRINITY_DN16337_c0_g1_i1:35-817(-)